MIQRGVRKRRLPLAAVLLLGWLGPVGCHSGPPRVSADLLYGSVTVDGRLSEDYFRQGNGHGPFVVLSGPTAVVDAPAGPGPAALLTEAFLAWDERNLYVAFFCEDPDIVARKPGVEDDPHDAVEIRLQTFGLLGQRVAVTVPAAEPERARGLLPGMECQTTVFGSVNDGGDTDRFYSLELKVPFRVLGQRDFALRRTGEVRVTLRRQDVSRGWHTELGFPDPDDGAEFALLEFRWSSR